MTNEQEVYNMEDNMASSPYHTDLNGSWNSHLSMIEVLNISQYKPAHNVHLLVL